MNLILGILIAAVATMGCATTQSTLAPAGDEAEGVRIRPLADGVWLFVASHEVDGFGDVPANGLVVAGADGVLLIDTPWTPEKTRTLLGWVERTLALPVTDVIFTHSHADRTGGVTALPQTARLHALAATAELSAREGRPFSPTALTGDDALVVGGVPVEILYPGVGHAPDNVVVWLPERRILFGGCFIKSAGSAGLGNVADADLNGWGAGIQLVEERYRNAAIVVPGHGDIGGPELLSHTRRLVEEALYLPSFP